MASDRPICAICGMEIREGEEYGDYYTPKDGLHKRHEIPEDCLRAVVRECESIATAEQVAELAGESLACKVAYRSAAHRVGVLIGRRFAGLLGDDHEEKRG